MERRRSDISGPPSHRRGGSARTFDLRQWGAYVLGPLVAGLCAWLVPLIAAAMAVGSHPIPTDHNINYAVEGRILEALPLILVLLIGMQLAKAHRASIREKARLRVTTSARDLLTIIAFSGAALLILHVDYARNSELNAQLLGAGLLAIGVGLSLARWILERCVQYLGEIDGCSTAPFVDAISLPEGGLYLLDKCGNVEAREGAPSLELSEKIAAHDEAIRMHLGVGGTVRVITAEGRVLQARQPSTGAADVVLRREAVTASPHEHKTPTSGIALAVAAGLSLAWLVRRRLF